MVFQTVEGIYYAVLFTIGSGAALVRILRDGPSSSFLSNIGGSFSGGVFSFGICGLWIGRTPDDVVGTFYFLALAALIGWLQPEMGGLIPWVVMGLLKKAGFISDDYQKPNKSD